VDIPPRPRKEIVHELKVLATANNTKVDGKVGNIIQEAEESESKDEMLSL